MANSHKGEVTLVAGDVSYTLRLGWNEISEIENVLLPPDASFFDAIAPKFGNPTSIRAGEWRAMLWGALGGSASGKTILDAGEIINEAGIEAVGVAIGKAVELAFPTTEAVAKNPPKAGHLTGKKP